ncbi:MAG: DUF2809 domain-containing protein [Cellulosilyticaceae bacterium]
MKIDKKYTAIFLTLFVVETLIALFIHDTIIRPFVGDILVIILVYSFIRIFWDNQSRLLPMYIFIFAAIVEFAQYFKIVEMLKVQHNPFLRVVIGTTFDINDIICYLVGALLLIAGQTWQKRKTINTF